MMLLQTRAVAEVLLGRDSGWSAQRRDDGRLPWPALVKAYAWPTVLGAALGIGAYVISLPLFVWMTPVLVGLVFAIPIVALTSEPRIGADAGSMRLLRTPEEHAPPEVLGRAMQHAAMLRPVPSEATILAMLRDRHLVEAHLAMLPEAGSRRKGEIDLPLLTALAKIDDADTAAEALDMLTRAECFTALGSREAMRRLLAKPGRCPT
jgi:membrane glycosyltransferase